MLQSLCRKGQSIPSGSASHRHLIIFLSALLCQSRRIRHSYTSDLASPLPFDRRSEGRMRHSLPSDFASPSPFNHLLVPFFVSHAELSVMQTLITFRFCKPIAIQSSFSALLCQSCRIVSHADTHYLQILQAHRHLIVVLRALPFHAGVRKCSSRARPGSLDLSIHDDHQFIHDLAF